ncbi:MAG: MSHA biogenesis protein MshO [Gammaproteobacteria bacterium]|nr:MSHA biogenesis protein MshO [Gammaproteobacteria bacterium]MBK82080.1 MSHA biogenesis protein MshO [Gammaproteobacteria bacterium]|tara:strand:- start:2437 stop:3228 length:792 start_codon:yes stop_codon:yes gene_type:complete
MPAAPAARRATGFTVVELVTVIVILGVLAAGTVAFIGDSSRGFASTVARSELAGEARFVTERLTRELRNALPGSVRVSGACIEFVPVAAASRYVTLPVATAASSFRSVPVDPVPAGTVRVAVHPGAAGYALASPGPISPPATLSAPGAGNEVTVTLAGPHRFASHSPTGRYFLVRDPVSYCIVGGALYRYRNYGFAAAQPGPATLPAGLPDRSLVAESLTSATPFTVSGATLTRNAVVGIDLTMTRDDDRVRLEHLVQVRNVP